MVYKGTAHLLPESNLYSEEQTSRDTLEGSIPLTSLPLCHSRDPTGAVV